MADGLITGTRTRKNYSVVSAPEETSHLGLQSLPQIGSEDEEVPNCDRGTDSSETTVGTPIHSVSAVEGRSSPMALSENKSRPRRGHQKSFSVSGAKIFLEDREDSVAQEKMGETTSSSTIEPPVGTVGGERSRGSSLLSSSSKQESSLSDGGEYDLEEERFLSTNDDIKTRSEVSFHTDTEVFLEGRPMDRQTSISLGTLNSHSEEESHTVIDGQSNVASQRLPSQLSAVVITNIDEYCASGEDEDEGESSRSPSVPQYVPTSGAKQGEEGNTSSLSNSSVNSEAAAVIRDLLHLSTGQTGSLSSAEKRISVGSDVFAEDIALSDIELKVVESPNSSFSTEGAPEEKMQVGNGSIPQRHSAQIAGSHHESSATRRVSLPVKAQAVTSSISSSQNLDDAAHSTISRLRFLTTGSSTPIFQEEGKAAGHWSDDLDALGHSESVEGQKSSPILSRQTASFNLRRTPANRVVRSATTVSEGGYNHRIHRHNPTLTVHDASSLDFPMSTTAPISPRKSEFGPHSPSPLVNITSPQSPTDLMTGSPRDFSSTSPVTNVREEEEPISESFEITSLKRGSVLLPSSSPKEKKNLSRSVDNLLADESTRSGLESSKGSKPTEDGKKDEKDTGIKLLRFRQFEDEGMFLPEDVKGSASVTEEAKGHEKSTKKGLTRLLSRRDSKKDKRPERVPKKSDSSSSLDSMAQPGTEESQHKYYVVKEKSVKTRPSAQEIEFVPPVSKNRSTTLGCVEELTLSGGSPATHHRRLNSKFDVVEEREESVSPHRAVSPSSKGETASLSGDRSETSSLSVSFEEPPELVEESLAYLNQTMNRRIKKYSNKHERSRQGTIFDWIRTEQHFYLSLILLKTLFRERLRVQLNLSEEVLQQLFPFLDGLIEVTKSFSQKLLKRQKETQLEDISDILLETFSGLGGEEMLRVYSGFVCREPAALELYRDLERKRGKFMRVINMLYQNKHCERKKLPDFYLLLAQRVSKYVEMMKKLIKESEALKLSHLPRLKESSIALDKLVTSVDLAVKEYNNQKELEDIQSHLEVQIPKSLMKTWDRKGLKNLDLVAQNRKLLKRGEAIWQGHGKQLGKI